MLYIYTRLSNIILPRFYCPFLRKNHIKYQTLRLNPPSSSLYNKPFMTISRRHLFCRNYD